MPLEPNPNAPDSDVAIVDGSRTFTYGDLRRRSDAVAAVLRRLGVGPEVVVAIALPRSAAQIVAALAILKAGGAYLPLDPAQPRERSAFELSDSGARVLLAGPTYDGPPAADVHTLALDADGYLTGKPRAGRLVATAGDVPPPAASANDLAYVVYTSGSTGRPKGVEISRGALANLIAWHRTAFGVTRHDRASHLSAVGFDAAGWEVWPYLAAGATIVVAGDALATDPAALRDWLVAQRTSIAFAATPLAEQLIDLAWPAPGTLRTLLTGADRLHRFAPPHLPFALVNNYGPTEATVVATSIHVETDGPATHPTLPPIGRAIDGAEVIVVASDGQPAAAGAVGEIWIGGAGVARGYRNLGELTAQRFVTATFARSEHRRFFRTGDLALVDPDGVLHFCGRNDEQLNIRGFRIEPAEIEAVLNEYPTVRASAVVAQPFAGGEVKLVAYIVGTQPGNTDAVTDAIARRLPPYMLPAELRWVHELPLTERGKIDRAALRARRDECKTDDDAEPQTATERRLLPVFAALFDGAPPGLDADLRNAGVHSLLIAKIIARVRDAFGVELGYRDAFAANSVRALALTIDRLIPDRRAAAAAPIRRRDRLTSMIAQPRQ